MLEYLQGSLHELLRIFLQKFLLDFQEVFYKISPIWLLEIFPSDLFANYFTNEFFEKFLLQSNFSCRNSSKNYFMNHSWASAICVCGIFPGKNKICLHVFFASVYPRATRDYSVSFSSNSYTFNNLRADWNTYET